jgi:hypothetical protein
LFNDTTKYIVSATLPTATWRNSKIIGPYAPDTICGPKDEVHGATSACRAPCGG